MQALKFLISSIIAVSLFTLALNVPTIYNQYTTTKKVCKVLIKYGQKNGGITTESKQRFENLIEEYHLEDKIQEVTYLPGVDIKVQKREKFGVIVTPIIKVNIPFVGEKTYIVKSIEATGYSHKFFK